jgi:hypothetical protein
MNRLSSLDRSHAVAFLVVACLAGCSAGIPPSSLPERSAAVPATPVSEPSHQAPPGFLPRSAVTEPGPASSMPAALRGPVAPIWHVGDQWAFRWESAEGQGEYVWTVNRVETVDRVDRYVIRSGPREIHFRASDLAVSLETLGGQVERRNSPARLGFSWPLVTGTTWRQRYVEERDGGVSAERSIEWKVEGEDEVRVEAGTFAAWRIVARHYPTPAVMYEMWYAPRVKQWVRLKEHFPSGVRYREMIAFDVR